MGLSINNEALLDCPECGADWRSSEIPLDSLRKGYYGEWHEGDPPRYFSRLIGCEYPGYDGVSVWLCPDCGQRWDRWTGDKVSPPTDRVEQVGEQVAPDTKGN